jgi:hypothetical protein
MVEIPIGSEAMDVGNAGPDRRHPPLVLWKNPP